MKNLKFALILLICAFCLVGCGKSKAITSNEFKEIMVDLNFSIIDVKEQFDAYDYIKEAYVALEKNKNYQIEFYVLDTSDSAKSFYYNNKEIFESSKESTAVYTNVDLNNKNKYTLSTGGTYKLLSRIDNTMIYLNVDSKYKDEVNKILKKLKY